MCIRDRGYTFYSETDTEVAVKLIAYYYEKTDHNPLESMSRALLRVRGSFALGIMFKDRPGVIYAARQDSPLIAVSYTHLDVYKRQGYCPVGQYSPLEIFIPVKTIDFWTSPSFSLRLKY